MIKLKDTYEKIFETVLHNYTCDDVELNLLQFSSPIGAFIFLICYHYDRETGKYIRFRPLSGLLFS